MQPTSPTSFSRARAWSLGVSSGQHKTSSPARRMLLGHHGASDSITGRLARIVVEKDLFSEARATLHTLISQTENLEPTIRDLADRLVPARDFTTQKTPTNDALKPIQKLIDELQAALSKNPSLAKPLKQLIESYQSFCRRFLAASPPQRATLLMPRSFICGDILGCFTLAPELARRLLCRDICGYQRKENAFGNHPVAAFKGIHFKPNPIGRDFISPGREFAVASLCKLLSPEITIAAPTALMKISHVPIQPLVPAAYQSDHAAYDQFMKLRQQNFSADEIFTKHTDLKRRLSSCPIFEERVVQAGFTIGYQPSAKYPAAVSLQHLLEFIELFNLLTSRLSEEELCALWPALLQASRAEVTLTAEQLVTQYMTFMSTVASSQRIAEFKEPKDLTEEGHKEVRTFAAMDPERRLHRFRVYLQQEKAKTWAALLTILKQCPILMEGKRFEDLIGLPRLFQWIPRLFPQATPRQIIAELPYLLNKIDPESFSALVVASFLINPSDGKADNYMVQIQRDRGGSIRKLHIVGIDNDRAFVPSFIRHQQGHNLAVKCVLYAMPSLMSQSIHRTIRKTLLASSPEELCIDWLTKLDERNQRYQRLIHQRVLAPSDLREHEEALDIPLTFPRGFLEAFCHKLRRLRTALRNPHCTLNQLFVSVDPLLYAYYQEVIREAPTPLAAQFTLFRGHQATAEAVLGPRMQAKDAR